jgi:uncharacterized protein (DUF58 family)
VSETVKAGTRNQAAARNEQGGERGARMAGTGLTGTGRTVVALAVVLMVLGVWLEYASLVAFAVAFFLITGAAVIWVSQRPRVDSSREVKPVRVSVGGSAISELLVENHTRRRTAGGVALEGFGDTLLPIVLPALDPGQSETVLQPLPTDHRGVFQVGPLLVSRSDPFGLLRVGQHQRDIATLWVHPRVIDLAPLPSGLHRDLDGPDSGDSPEGGITFHNLREYVEGDDLRLVHWRSFAKTDVLMVRHNIDSHQPRSIVLLDTRAAVHDEVSIEHAISVAASIVIASMIRRFPFSLQTTCGVVLNQGSTRAQVLDAMAGLKPSATGSIERNVRTLGRDPGGSSLAVISGRASTEDLACVAPLRTRFDAITIGRFGPHEGSEVTLAPGAVLVNAQSVNEFAKAWNRRAR